MAECFYNKKSYQLSICYYFMNLYISHISSMKSMRSSQGSQNNEKQLSVYDRIKRINESYQSKIQPQTSLESDMLRLLLQKSIKLEKQNQAFKKQMIKMRVQFEVFQQLNVSRQQYRSLQVQMQTLKQYFNQNIQIKRRETTKTKKKMNGQDQKERINEEKEIKKQRQEQIERKQQKQYKLTQKKEQLQKIQLKNDFQEQVINMLKDQSQKIDNQNKRFNNFQRSVNQLSQETGSIKRIVQSLEDQLLNKSEEDDLQEMLSVIDKSAKKNQQLEQNEKIYTSFICTPYQQYQYKKEYKIIFREKANKFKKDKDQLLQYVEINLNEEFNKKIYWIDIKNQDSMIHKAAGFLVKGKSQIKKFNGKQQNVMLSVFLINKQKKPIRQIFKIQFEESQN